MAAGEAGDSVSKDEGLRGAILDSTLDAIVVMDADGRIIEFNRAAEQKFGHRREDVIGREMAAVIIPEQLRAAHREALADYLRTGRKRILGKRVELTALRAGEEEFPVELTVVRLPGSDPPVFAGYVRDITRRRRAESERERAIAREREAREMAEREQRRSQRLLADALEAEERQRREISETLHDEAIQSLSAARLDLDAAREGDAEALDRVKEELDRTLAEMRGVITDLHPVILRRPGLDAALESIVRRAERRGRFRATLRVEDRATGSYDALLLSVARELLSNVVKHAKATRVAVTVERRRDRRRLRGQRGETIILKVADDGRGIGLERADAALDEGHIGLASVDARLAAAGGGLEVTGEAGRGTVARAWIPLSDSGIRRRLRGDRRAAIRQRR